MKHADDSRTHPAWRRWRSRTKVRAARLISGAGTAVAGAHRRDVGAVPRGPAMGP